MKTKKAIMQQAKQLLRSSLNGQGNVDRAKVAKILKLVHDSDMRNKVSLLKAYRKQVERRIREHTATVEVAQKSGYTKVELEKALFKKYGKNYVVEIVENPQLISGIRLTLNDTIYDMSTLGGLEQIKDRL